MTLRFRCALILVILLRNFIKHYFLTGGAPDAGWTSYASLAMLSPGHGVDYYVAGLRLRCRYAMGGINFLATIVTMVHRV